MSKRRVYSENDDCMWFETVLGMLLRRALGKRWSVSHAYTGERNVAFLGL